MHHKFLHKSETKYINKNHAELREKIQLLKEPKHGMMKQKRASVSHKNKNEEQKLNEMILQCAIRINRN